MAKQQRGRPPVAREFETVKWTPRVRPADLARFLAVRAELSVARGVRVSDAEVFRLAVLALESPAARRVRG